MSSEAEAKAKPHKEEAEEEEARAIDQVVAMRSAQQDLLRRLGDIEQNLSEHKLVLEALKKVEPTRRCHRLIGGVLIERTAGDLLPALQESYDVLLEAQKETTDLLEKRGKEMEDFMKEHKLTFLSREEAEAAQMRQ